MAARKKRSRVWLERAVIAVLVLCIGAELVYWFRHRARSPARTCPRRNGWSRTSCRSTRTPAPARRSRRSTAWSIHYVGNPGTSAAANRSFFANLALTHETYRQRALRRGAGGRSASMRPALGGRLLLLAGERSHRFHRGLPRRTRRASSPPRRWRASCG